jgi:hypothetical protein
VGAHVEEEVEGLDLLWGQTRSPAAAPAAANRSRGGGGGGDSAAGCERGLDAGEALPQLSRGFFGRLPHQLRAMQASCAREGRRRRRRRRRRKLPAVRGIRLLLLLQLREASQE